MWLFVPVLLATAAVAGARSAADPIEGTWSFSGGAVTVTAQGAGRFTGTVTKETRFSTCPHPVGQAMWQISAAGGGNYTGTHVGFTDLSTCTAANPPFSATWKLKESAGAYGLEFCDNVVGNGIECTTLARLKAR